LRRLKLPNQVVEDVCYCVENHMNFMNVKKMRLNTLKRFIRQPTFEVEMDLHKLDCLASHGDMEIHRFLLEKRDEFGKEKIAPLPLITGKRLVDLGYTPGPLFKKILTEIEDLQLDDKMTTSEEAEAYVIKKFPR
jgi:poly(A) polymerase